MESTTIAHSAAACLTQSVLPYWQSARSLTFADLKGIPHKGFVAVAKSRLLKTMEVGKKYCLSFASSQDTSYSPRFITFHLYVYQNRSVFAKVGSFSYSTPQSLLKDFEPSGSW